MLLALNIIVQFSYNQLNIQFYIVAMDTLCCMGLTIASRMISTYTLAFSILLINVFTSHLLTKTQKSEFFKILDSWSPVGLSWTFIFKYIQLDNQFEIIAISCTVIILYSSLFFVTSGYLAYGSTVRESKYAIPWLYMQMFSIIDQFATAGTQLIIEGYDVFKKYALYTSLCYIYLLLNVYFWLVVEGARKEWLENREILTTNIQQTSENVINEVVVKSPSYVSTTLMANQQFASRRINDLPSYDSLENVT